MLSDVVDSPCAFEHAAEFRVSAALVEFRVMLMLHEVIEYYEALTQSYRVT